MIATAGQIGLFQIDALLEECAELMAIGRSDEAFATLIMVRQELDKRVGDTTGAPPVDVLLRKLKTSMLLAETLSDRGFLDQAVIHGIEAAAVSREPLKEFPEFFIQSVYLLCRLYAKKQDMAPARNYIADAMKKIPGLKDESLYQAMMHIATGMLARGAGRNDLARAALGSAIRLLGERKLTAEQAILKADAIMENSFVEGGPDGAAKNLEWAFRILHATAHERMNEGETSNSIKLWGRALRVAEMCAGPKPEGYHDALFGCAELLETRGRWKHAETLYEDLRAEIAVAAGNGQSQLYIRVMAELGKIRCERKEYQDARVLLEEAEQLSEEKGHRLLSALVNYYLGLNFSKAGSDQEGLLRFGKAMAFISNDEQVDALSLKAAVTNQYGFLERKRGGLERAIQHHLKALEFLEKSPVALVRGEAFRLLGDCYTERKQHMQAERALKKSLEIYEKHNAYYELAKTYKSIGLNYLGSGEIDKAVYFIDQSIAILQRLGIQTDLPMLYSERGKICLLLEETEEAERFFKMDYDIAKNSKSPHALAFSYFQLGRVKRLMTRTHSAIDFFKRAQPLFEKVKNRKMEAETLIELALAESDLKNVKMATDYCARAKEVMGDAPATLQARLLRVRGVVLRDAKRRYMGQCCFEESIQLQEKENRLTPELADTYFDFGLFWNEGGNRKKAEEIIMNAVDIAEKLSLTKKVSTYMAKLAQINPEAGAKIQLRRFMDKSTAEQLTQGKAQDSFRVERKELSILFIDIRGFTSTSEKLSLDELSSFLNDFYSAVTQVVLKYQGRINKFIGDEVMALFNMDGNLPDHQMWAVRAGMALVRTMDEVNRIRGNRGEPPIFVGVGVNTGEVLLGIFGSSLRQEYTAIGDSVNVAARLQGQARGGEVVISDTVYEFVKERTVAEDMGEKPLKGKGAPLRLWKILDLKE